MRRSTEQMLHFSEIPRTEDGGRQKRTNKISKEKVKKYSTP
jgi:hypothetical protein